MAFATHCANTPRTIGHVLFGPDNFQELEREFRVEYSIGCVNGLKGGRGYKGGEVSDELEGEVRD